MINEKSKFSGSGDSTLARVKLKVKLTELHYQEWIVRLNLTQRGTTYQNKIDKRLYYMISIEVVHGRWKLMG